MSQSQEVGKSRKCRVVRLSGGAYDRLCLFNKSLFVPKICWHLWLIEIPLLHLVLLKKFRSTVSGVCQWKDNTKAIKQHKFISTHVLWNKKRQVLLKSVYKWMSLYKCPLYDHSWPFFCHMYGYLSQNWGSDGHFVVVNRSKSWLGQELWPQM